MAGHMKDYQKHSVPPFHIAFFGGGGWNIDTCHLGEGIICHQLEKYQITPEMNMSPRRGPFEREISSSNHQFLGDMLVFSGRTFWNLSLLEAIRLEDVHVTVHLSHFMAAKFMVLKRNLHQKHAENCKGVATFQVNRWFHAVQKILGNWWNESFPWKNVLMFCFEPSKKQCPMHLYFCTTSCIDHKEQRVHKKYTP